MIVKQTGNTALRTISVGECFLMDGQVFMRIDCATAPYKVAAVQLANGKFLLFNDVTQVCPVKVTAAW